MDSIAPASQPSAPPALSGARRYSLAIFLAGTFLVSWLLLALRIIATAAHVPPPLPDTLLITLATLGPTLGAIAASAYESGGTGVRCLLRSMGRWRVAPGWYGSVVLGPGLLVLSAFPIWLVLGGPLPPAPPLLAWLSVPILIPALLVPALFEEIGWRGYLLPRLQAHYGLLRAGLIVGGVHACWHIPIFLIPSAGFGTLPFPLFALFVVALGIVMAWVYNGTGGSVLLVALLHAAINAWPVPWTAAVGLLPEGARGPHVQIALALALAIWALGLSLSIRRPQAPRRARIEV